MGENGVGKSSILQGIIYVLGGSYSKIESIGFSSLFNNIVIEEFMASKKKYQDLPELEIELYINECVKNFNINGKHNSQKQECNGLKLVIAPDDDFSTNIVTALKSSNVFPFEYYKLDFLTFAGKSYNSMKRYSDFIRYSFIDTSKTNSEHALKDYIGRIYESQGDVEQRKIINNAYRDSAQDFSDKLYSDYNLVPSTDGYAVTLDVNHENTFKDNITVKKSGIDIKSLGQGERVFINTDFSLTKAPDDIKIVLIEEPENHLSYLSMHKLIDKIAAEHGKQTFIATHSNMIAARLNLQNVIFLSNSGCEKLLALPNKNAKFFEKAPDNNVLNFILAEKNILVEGSAEYILIENFYAKAMGCPMHEKGVGIISCGGKNFKSYLQLAKILGKKTAVITDNDGDYKKNIEDKYDKYADENMQVFADENNTLSTLEIALYECNEKFYNDNIRTAQMINGVQEFMLNNKAEAALRLLLEFEKKSELQDEFIIPKYIEDAIKWISE